MRNRKKLTMVALVALGSLAAMPVEPDPAPAAATGIETYGIEMVDFAYRPARVTARPGDVLRFVQQGIQPHNVMFKQVPPGVDLGNAKMGPFMVRKGDVYELRLDRRFKPGTYVLVCTPHELMGMTAQLTILPAGS